MAKQRVLFSRRVASCRVLGNIRVEPSEKAGPPTTVRKAPLAAFSGMSSWAFCQKENREKYSSISPAQEFTSNWSVSIGIVIFFGRDANFVEVIVAVEVLVG